MYAFFHVKTGLGHLLIYSQFLEEGEQKVNNFWKRIAEIELSISLL